MRHELPRAHRCGGVHGGPLSQAAWREGRCVRGRFYSISLFEVAPLCRAVQYTALHPRPARRQPLRAQTRVGVWAQQSPA